MERQRAGLLRRVLFLVGDSLLDPYPVLQVESPGFLDPQAAEPLGVMRVFRQYAVAAGVAREGGPALFLRRRGQRLWLACQGRQDVGVDPVTPGEMALRLAVQLAKGVQLLLKSTLFLAKQQRQELLGAHSRQVTPGIGIDQ